MTYLSTGEVSKKLDISLRTLRYYDEINLVKPTLKENNGKRYYSTDDLLLLEKILLLKSASISLEDIKKIMNQVTIQTTLSIHKTQLEDKIKHLQQSLNHTNTLVNMLKLDDDIHWEQLLPLLSEENQSLKRHRKNDVMNKLFNKEQQEALKKQLPKMESNSDHLLKWLNLAKRIELCIEDGKTFDSPEGQLIAHDTLLLSNEMFNGDDELAKKFWEARKSEEISADLNLYPVKKEIILFLEKAINYYENN